MITPLTTEEIQALPASVDLVKAGQAFGMGRTKSYEMARAGQFPCPVLPLGKKFRVAKADILRVLKIEQPATSDAAVEAA